MVRLLIGNSKVYLLLDWINMKNKSSLISNLSYTTIGMVLYNIALWLLSFLVLRVLGDIESGYYGIAMTIGATLYGVALWGLRSFIVSDEDYGFTYSDYTIVRLIAIFLAIIGMLVYIFYSRFNTYQNWVIVLYSTFKFSEALIELIDCFNQKELKMDINAKSMMIRSVLLLFGFFISIYITKSLILGLIIINIVTLGVLLFYNFRKFNKMFGFKFEINEKHVRKVMWLTMPIMGFEMLSALTTTIPRIKYAQVGDIGKLGIYLTIYTIIVFLQLVIQIVNVAFAPYMAKDYNANRKKSFLKKLLTLFALAISLGVIAEILVFFLGKFVIGLVYGENIAPYYTYMYWAIISGVTLGITWIFSQLFVILKKNKEQLFCSIISVITCYILSNFMVDPNDLNSISKILILANLTFTVISLLILFYDFKFKRVH